MQVCSMLKVWAKAAVCVHVMSTPQTYRYVVTTLLCCLV